MKAKKIFTGVALLLLSFSANGQNDSISKSFFSQRDFGKYFISDTYAPLSSVQLGLGLNLKEYNLSTKRKSIYVPYNETTLGVEIPIFKNQKSKSKLSLSIPISVCIWFDFLKK